MKKLIKIFHYVSFIKYPILIISIYFCYKPILSSEGNMLESLNLAFIFMGLGIGIDSLKDYTKLNWLDKKVLHRPKIAKYYFVILGLVVLGLISFGITSYLSTNDNNLKELSIGLIVLGIGTIGFLKSGIEATKNYIDKEK